MAKVKTGNPLIANAGDERLYYRKLAKMIRSMERDVGNRVKTVYAENERRIEDGGDVASIGREVTQVVKSVMKKWEARFASESKTMAKWFARKADSHVRSAVGRDLSRRSGLTVKFGTTKEVESVLDGIVANNVALIKSIPVKYHGYVQDRVMDSVKKGRDLGGLTDRLEGVNGITRRRAAMIARDQNNKATESIGLARNVSLGIKEGVWMHRSGSKEPRGSHVAANGKKFKLSEGLMIDGEMIFPGQKINCNCTFRPVIPDNI